MGVTKTQNFSTRQNELARLAKAFAHPARIAIIEHLLNKTTCVCGDLVDELPLAQATVSQHLKELKEAGILQGDIEGTRVCYCIDREAWEDTRKQFNELFNSLTEINSC
ncbi:metalloregulator ArsR/SmtB family transcription factor [Fulvivirgaceae bacterium BMA10]|uniref:Metalloregulator ArsR/SmtB family transcription factor n=1 Tax=Splendidivirga corallicola TaxID=3051826 RepID=A0ABT8KJI1_9BACT|nr:metalloregulator ArsR/SmtB family transcription factor [Fulvivirgaceae bacterium BMA10]